MVTEIKIEKSIIGKLGIVNTNDIPKNWYIFIDYSQNKLGIINLSKANKERSEKPEFIKLEEGSLFLVNRTYESYYFFRSKQKMNFIKKYNIEKIKSIKGPLVDIILSKSEETIIDPIVIIKGYKEISSSQPVSFTSDSNENKVGIIYKKFLKENMDDGINFIIQQCESGRKIIYIDKETPLSSIEKYL